MRRLCSFASGAALLVGGGLMLSACSDPTLTWRKPEIATCERFIRSGLKVPSSFRRREGLVADFPVTRALFAEATGRPDLAKSAPSPVIRRVFIQFYADDGTRSEQLAADYCNFPMTDGGAGTYAQDINAATDEAIIENERRSLSTGLGDKSTSAQCCLVPTFDPTVLLRLKSMRRGSVTTARPM